MGRRRPVVIRRAVQRVLDDDRHWRAARSLRAELTGLDDPLAVIHHVLSELAPSPSPAAQVAAPAVAAGA